jgi:hypothetical protein
VPRQFGGRNAQGPVTAHDDVEASTGAGAAHDLKRAAADRPTTLKVPRRQPELPRAPRIRPKPISEPATHPTAQVSDGTVVAPPPKPPNQNRLNKIRSGCE